MSLEIAKTVVWNMLQQAAQEEGPGGPIPTELNGIIGQLERGEVTPRRGLDLARSLMTLGENGIAIQELAKIEKMKIH